MKRVLLVLAGVAAVVVLGGAVWWFTSTDIDDPVEVTAPPISSADSTIATSDGSDTTTTGEPTATTATTTTADGAETFELTDASTVTFEIDEVLNGNDKRVVATNTEVAAQLSVDPSDLSSTRIGTVVIGAQTFETDSGNRNRAIRGPILDSNAFPTIEFAPTGIEGLNGSAAVGDVIEFTITGDLTIRDVTNEVTFDVSATLADEDTIEVTGETTVSREAFELQIPSVPSVADVSDEVLLRIDLVADAVG